MSLNHVMTIAQGKTTKLKVGCEDFESVGLTKLVGTTMPPAASNVGDVFANTNGTGTGGWVANSGGVIPTFVGADRYFSGALVKTFGNGATTSWTEVIGTANGSSYNNGMTLHAAGLRTVTLGKYRVDVSVRLEATDYASYMKLAIGVGATPSVLANVTASMPISGVNEVNGAAASEDTVMSVSGVVNCGALDYIGVFGISEAANICTIKSWTMSAVKIL